MADLRELRWAAARHSRIPQVLHDPRHAGALVYGRTRTRHLPDGGASVIRMPKPEWQFVMPGMHPGYIDWDRFEGNPRRLAGNARNQVVILLAISTPDQRLGDAARESCPGRSI